jgi:hypothetical protein
MTTFQEVMAEHDVLYAVIASPDGSKWEEHGDRGKLPYQGIVDSYFPGPEGMKALGEFLEGQVLPKTPMQGEVMCVICKPSDEIIVGCFVTGAGDVFSRIGRGRAICASVEMVFRREGT